MGVGLKVREFSLDEEGVEVLVREREFPNFLHFDAISFDLIEGAKGVRIVHYEHPDND
jgi:hypothetical protein